MRMRSIAISIRFFTCLMLYHIKVELSAGVGIIYVYGFSSEYGDITRVHPKHYSTVNGPRKVFKCVCVSGNSPSKSKISLAHIENILDQTCVNIVCSVACHLRVFLIWRHVLIYFSYPADIATLHDIW